MCPYDALKTYYYVALSHTTNGVRTQGVDAKSAGKALGGLLVLLYMYHYMYHYICVPMLLIPRTTVYESSCYAGGLTQRANGKALGGLLANLRRQSVTLPSPSLSLLLDAGVDTKSTGKALGGLLANLKAGRGLFGEEATMKAVGKITETIEQVA
jgi:hypothetical protein